LHLILNYKFVYILSVQCDRVKEITYKYCDNNKTCTLNNKKENMVEIVTTMTYAI
jgi:hypothetical protein